jgi:hypothetical protein
MPITREQVVTEIRAAASRNAGRPPGARAFHTETGISRNDLWNTGFPRYSDAVKAAGLVPNKLQTALDSDSMLVALASVVRRLGVFPSISDLKVVRAEDPAFPSYEAYFRLAGGAYRNLPSLLVDFCQRRQEYQDITRILQDHSQHRAAENGHGARKKVVGYVYLAKHGRDYKLGRSNDVARRRRELALLLPAELTHVHIIETDDPEGIEAYWQRRFEARRVRGEWFRLAPSDVAAFKWRRYQ